MHHACRKFPDVKAALESGEQNALVVVGVMIQVADADSKQDKRGASLCVGRGQGGEGGCVCV